MRTTILLGLLAICMAPAVAGADPALERAHRILEAVPLIDGHNDVPMQYRRRVDNRISALDLAGDTSRLDPPMHTDIPRLRQGRVGGQFWSVYVPPAYSGDEAVRIQLEQLDVALRLIELHDDLEFVTTADDVEAAFARGRIASLLGIEGGHVIADSLANLRMFHAIGARYMTLTHWQSHGWADAATDEQRHGGLSDFGKDVVREMNRLGMLVDLSHVHPDTMRDALDVSEAPVIFSHSSAMGVTAHPRNVPDAILDRVRGNGGVVMVTFVPVFVNEEVRQWDARREAEEARLARLHPGQLERIDAGMAAWREQDPEPRATLADVADHIDHIRARIGAAHIGIGADYDGITTVPVGLEDAATYPALFAELVRRGYSDDELKDIAGNNVLRVMREAERTAARLRVARPAADP